MLLAGLAVLVCVDTADAARRRRGNNCCCDGYGYGYSGGGYRMSGYGGYSYGSPVYSTGYASACTCQPTGYASTYPVPMGGGTVSGYGDPNQYGTVQYSAAGTGAIPADKARLRVQVPTAETLLWVNNQQVQMGGTDRSADVALMNNQSQKFTLTAQWVKDGRQIVRKKEVELRPGQESTVTFSDADEAGVSEQIPSNPNVSPTPVNPPIRPDNNLPKPDRP
jgi:uncharacterized protein (TIGR03000 family)